MIGYGIEVTGGKMAWIHDDALFKRYLQKAMEAAAKTVERQVRAQLRIVENDAKHSTGNIMRALKRSSGEGWAAVYMDERVAPYAPYVEKGVKPHLMDYLLKAERAIPIKVGNATIYRFATRKWMGRPHPIVDPASGMVMSTTGWTHPGYDGKWYFRKGTEEGLEIVAERLKFVVFKAFEMDDPSAIPEDL